MIGSTLSDREARDAARAAGAGPHLRADDAAGHAALARCMATGEPRAECLAEVESAIDSRGFYCGAGVLHITAAGKVCGAAVAPSSRKVAILASEAAARAADRTPLYVGGAILVALGAWLWLR